MPVLPAVFRPGKSKIAWLVLVYLPILPMSVHATSITDTRSLSLTNQGMFGGTGANPAYDSFFGAEWGFQWGGAGSIADTFIGSFGGVVGGTVQPGRFGIDVNALFNSGTIDYSQNVTAQADFYSAGFNQIGYDTSLALGQGSFSAGSLQWSAAIDLIADVNLSASGEVCVFGCVSASGTLLDIDATVPLIELNKTPGELEILGITYPKTTNGVIRVTDPSGAFRLLDVSAPLAPANVFSSGTGVLTGSGSGTLMEMDANYLNLLAFTTGLPPMSGTFANIFEYNVMNAGGNLKLTLHQDISVSSAATLTLNVAQTGASIPITLGSVGTGFINNTSGLTNVTVTPRLDYTTRVTNRTYLSLDPSLNFSAGTFGIPSVNLSVGPIYSATYNPGTVNFDVFNRYFDIPMGSFLFPSSNLQLCTIHFPEGNLPPCALPGFSHSNTPVNLVASDFGNSTDGPGNIFDPANGSIDDFNSLFLHQRQPDPVPEPGTMLLLGSGIGVLARAYRERRKST
jgi:hypothetical protein